MSVIPSPERNLVQEFGINYSGDVVIKEAYPFLPELMAKIDKKIHTAVSKSVSNDLSI